MAKVALLIGVSEYGQGLNPLPSAIKDVEAMQRVLQNPEIGQFDQVKTLTNPDPQAIQREVEAIFRDRTKNDLILLFFSGHGIKDDNGRLYFATSMTHKTPDGELAKWSAVPANFVHDMMANSRSRRQVILLDCCFSGAFAEDMRAKDDGSVDIQTQLGGEGRAVLTSSSSTQYSFEQQGADLSIYTRFLVEGLETGAADVNGNGEISINELHEYACRKVQESAPAMKPKIYVVEEGFRILLAKAPKGEPKLIYRKEVERSASRGEISSVARYTLGVLQRKLGI
ncbi:caspase family protein [Oculatella sp. FACHB-28]|uniref:caspase, EACC1-associated type n=1 Tax=Oculatella sp. FACHB-28 TaxID=2692845 RepID=UPI00168A082D|nr:caspase family protein [Oculatella sp. FACHB-28]